MAVVDISQYTDMTDMKIYSPEDILSGCIYQYWQACIDKNCSQ